MRDHRSHPAPSLQAPRVSRRSLIQGAAALFGLSSVPGLLPRSVAASTAVAPARRRAAPSGTGVEWLVTTAKSPWQRRDVETASGGGADVRVQTGTPLQVIEGFGACFK